MARLDDVGVEGEPAPKLSYNPEQHRRILLERVRVVGGHNAAAAELLESDDRVTEPGLAARPRSLGKTFHAGYENVRAESAAVDT